MKRIALSLALCVFLPASAAPGAEEDGAVEMTVKTLVVDPLTQSPVVLLETAADKRTLPIWIGIDEATSIAIELKKVSIPRPNTHDLVRNILRGLGAVVERITISDVRNDVYYATIALVLKGQGHRIDSRPSDAIAVALRTKAPIFATAKVLAMAKSISPSAKAASEARTTLGIHVQDLTPELAGLFGIKPEAGILVADVEPGGLASQAGMQRGDVITKANDKNLQRAAELENFLKTVKKGAALKIEVIRKGKPAVLTMSLPS